MRRGSMLRMVSVSLVTLAGCGGNDSDKGGMTIQAPGVHIQVGPEGTSVRAPGVDVGVEAGRARVQAPGVDASAGPEGASLQAPGTKIEARR